VSFLACLWRLSSLLDSYLAFASFNSFVVWPCLRGNALNNIKTILVVAKAQVLFILLGLALVAGICALPHGAVAATETLDEIANLRASNITGNGTATSIHLQVNANDIAGSTLNVTESDYNATKTVGKREEGR
jgi:hypothetical protein